MFNKNLSAEVAKSVSHWGLITHRLSFKGRDHRCLFLKLYRGDHLVPLALMLKSTTCHRSRLDKLYAKTHFVGDRIVGTVSVLSLPAECKRGLVMLCERLRWHGVVEALIKCTALTTSDGRVFLVYLLLQSVALCTLRRALNLGLTPSTIDLLLSPAPLRRLIDIATFSR